MSSTFANVIANAISNATAAKASAEVTEMAVSVSGSSAVDVDENNTPHNDQSSECSGSSSASVSSSVSSSIVPDCLERVCEVGDCCDAPLEEGRYCNRHTCNVEFCPDVKCYSNNLDRSDYCREHRCECDFEYCGGRKSVDHNNLTRFNYCQSHRCVYSGCKNCQLIDSDNCVYHQQIQTERLQSQYQTYQTQALAARQVYLSQAREAVLQAEQENPFKGRINCRNVVKITVRSPLTSALEESHRPCFNMAYPGRFYCSDCLCAFGGCENIAFKDGPFCRQHQCTAKSCLNEISDDSLYCVEHRCQFVNSPTERCYHRTLGENWFCADHMCQYDQCERQRETGNYFCSMHYETY